MKGKIYYIAYDGDDVVGFICLKFHNQYTADIYVIGILKKYHRRGIGIKLVEVAEQYLKKNGYKFFMVKTLGESSDYEFYKRTREFYRSVGFYPLEEFKEIHPYKFNHRGVFLKLNTITIGYTQENFLNRLIVFII